MRGPTGLRSGSGFSVGFPLLRCRSPDVASHDRAEFVRLDTPQVALRQKLCICRVDGAMSHLGRLRTGCIEFQQADSCHSATDPLRT